jgi:hypothetical protein
LDFITDLPPELIDGVEEAGAHALLFGLADLADPAILQHRNRDQYDTECAAQDKPPHRAF